MKKILYLLLCLPVFTRAQIITIVAGNGISSGYTGDGGPATDAKIWNAAYMAVDDIGNIFIADRANHAIRKVDTFGIITTIAGNGTAGFTGDSGPASAALLNDPEGISVDHSGNIIFADAGNNRIRKISTSGMISTIAGNGNCCYATDGGLADTSTIAVLDIALDAADNIYFTDRHARVREINASDGIITTIAGTGTAGVGADSGPATATAISATGGLTLDNGGNIYLAEFENSRVRKINTSGIISTIAGNGAIGYSGDGGPATAAPVAAPYDVAIDAAGNLYISQNGQVTVFGRWIRKVDPSGTISTYAGNGSLGLTGNDGPATAAAVFRPNGIVCDIAGNVYFAQPIYSVIRKIGSASIAHASVDKLVPPDKISISPNPAKNKLLVTAQEKITNITFINVLGKTVCSNNYNQDTVEIDLTQLPAGIYLIKINGTEVRKFVKQ